MPSEMTEFDLLIHNIVNRAVPDRGQVISNLDMFGTILRYTKKTEMYVLDDIDYSFVFHNGQDNDFDNIAQMLAFLQMTCFTEIRASKFAHTIDDIEIREANAELWYKRFSNRINSAQKFYIH